MSKPHVRGRRTNRWWSFSLLVIALLPFARLGAAPIDADIVLRGGILHDGNGGAPVAGDQLYTPEQKQKVIDHHTTTEQAGTVFSQVKPKLAVYSHVVPFNAQDLVAHTRKTYSGPLEVGEDLMSIDIGDKVEVHRATK